MRRLLLAAGRARAAGASARARLAKFERVLPPGRLKAAGRQYSPRKARTGCSGCCAGGRCAGRCCAGWRAVRPPAAAAPAPSLAGAVAPRAPNSAGTRHASSHSRGEQAVLCVKRARSRTFKAGSGHSKGIPLRMAPASLPPSHINAQLLVTLSISRLANTKCCDREWPISFFFSFLGPVGTLPTRW